MSNTPDFMFQVQEVERDLKAEWLSAHKGWQDSVAEGFNSGVMEPYLRNFQQYLTGEGINGNGLHHLLQQMDKHLQEMATLTD